MTPSHAPRAGALRIVGVTCAPASRARALPRVRVRVRVRVRACAPRACAACVCPLPRACVPDTGACLTRTRAAPGVCASRACPGAGAGVRARAGAGVRAGGRGRAGGRARARGCAARARAARPHGAPRHALFKGKFQELDLGLAIPLLGRVFKKCAKPRPPPPAPPHRPVSRTAPSGVR
jgi:hypothetical protein